MDITVNSEKDYGMVFKENDTVRSIVQNIALLLSTKKGTVPMYREFGLPMKFIDKPIDVAETMTVLEVTEALEEFEPRAKLRNINLTKSASGRMAIEVEVTI